MRQTLVDPTDELLDRLGLITGGCEVGFELERSLVLFHARAVAVRVSGSGGS
jgi:hypothetical protein